MIRACRAASLPLAAMAAFATQPSSFDDSREARALGVDGVLLFSYDSLVSPARGADTLSRIGAQAFGQ